MYCPECGAKVEQGMPFCCVCGARVSGSEDQLRKLDKLREADAKTMLLSEAEPVDPDTRTTVLGSAPAARQSQERGPLSSQPAAATVAAAKDSAAPVRATAREALNGRQGNAGAFGPQSGYVAPGYSGVQVEQRKRSCLGQGIVDVLSMPQVAIHMSLYAALGALCSIVPTYGPVLLAVVCAAGFGSALEWGRQAAYSSSQTPQAHLFSSPLLSWGIFGGASLLFVAGMGTVLVGIAADVVGALADVTPDAISLVVIFLGLILIIGAAIASDTLATATAVHLGASGSFSDAFPLRRLAASCWAHPAGILSATLAADGVAAALIAAMRWVLHAVIFEHIPRAEGIIEGLILGQLGNPAITDLLSALLLFALVNALCLFAFFVALAVKLRAGSYWFGRYARSGTNER